MTGWYPRARVGQDPGAGWTQEGGKSAAKLAQEKAQGYTTVDAMNLALKTSGLLNQMIDLSEQTAGESEEVEVLKAKVAATNAGAQVFAKAFAGGGAMYQSLLGQYNAEMSAYSDILSRAVPAEPEPPVVVTTPSGTKVAVPAPKPSPGTEKASVTIKPAAPTWGYWIAGGLVAAGLVTLKLAKVF